MKNKIKSIKQKGVSFLNRGSQLLLSRLCRTHHSNTQNNTQTATETNIRGFTLIEIMVVVVILGILATFVLPNIFGRPDEARIAKARQDVRAIEGALQLYKLDNFRYPNSGQGLEALVKKPSGDDGRFWRKDGYMDRIPKDPWGNEYQYRSPGNNGAIDIYSFGADGTEGGEGVDADVGNWTR